MISFVDFSSQREALHQSIEATVIETIQSGNYILGPSVEKLEIALCEYTGARYCISCGNGTDALVAALMALEVKPGDEVITPAFSYIAATEAILSMGAKPVFVDVKQDTQNIDVDLVSELITPQTKAVISVSLYGQPCDLLELKKICKDHNIYLVEDAAQSFGSTHHNKKSCSIADISTTSFFPTKPLGCYGDGGAIFTNNSNLSNKIRKIVRHGQSQKYQHDILGMNSRLDSLQASILLEKLKILDAEIKSRNKLSIVYDSHLSDWEGILTPTIMEYNFSSIAQYTIVTDYRDLIIKKFKEQNIPYAIHYPIPIYRQKLFKGSVYGSFDALEKTEVLCDRVISLPINAYMTEAEIEKVSVIIQSALAM